MIEPLAGSTASYTGSAKLAATFHELVGAIGQDPAGGVSGAQVAAAIQTPETHVQPLLCVNVPVVPVGHIAKRVTSAGLAGQTGGGSGVTVTVADAFTVMPAASEQDCV